MKNEVCCQNPQVWLARLGEARPTDLVVARKIVDFWIEKADDIHIGCGEHSSLQAMIKDELGELYGVIGLWRHAFEPVTVNLHLVKNMPGSARKRRRHPVLNDNKKRMEVVHLFEKDSGIPFEFTSKQKATLEGFPKIKLIDIANYVSLNAFLNSCEKLFNACHSI